MNVTKPVFIVRCTMLWLKSGLNLVEFGKYPVSKRDALHFWQGSTLNYQKVREFTGFDVGDIARMAGVSKSSVRYDSKAPKEVREHLENIANICNLVFQFFQDDVKTKLWLQTPNPMLGNVSPRDMLRFGRYAKILKFITEAMEEGSAGFAASQTETAAV